MDPQAQFCHNPDGPARGQLGLGDIRAHRRRERRDLALVIEQRADLRGERWLAHRPSASLSIRLSAACSSRRALRRRE